MIIKSYPHLSHVHMSSSRHQLQKNLNNFLHEESANNVVEITTTCIHDIISSRVIRAVHMHCLLAQRRALLYQELDMTCCQGSGFIFVIGSGHIGRLFYLSFEIKSEIIKINQSINYFNKHLFNANIHKTSFPTAHPLLLTPHPVEFFSPIVHLQ